MITIENGEGCITITGHADYAPYGQDIVCAAVSTLTQTFVTSVECLTNDDINYKMAAGDAVIKYGNLSGKGTTLLDSFFVGVQMIANSYPQYVEIV